MAVTLYDLVYPKKIFKHLTYHAFILLYDFIVKFVHTATSYMHKQKLLKTTRFTLET